MRVRKDASFEKKYPDELAEVTPNIDISQQVSLFKETDLA
jgi:hypothetical protein